MEIDIQRLRTLTTGRLHTPIEDVYEDLERITGVPGVMTHMIPNIMRAIEPWLRSKVQDSRFWDGKFDTTHTGTAEIPEMTEAERKAFLKRFGELPSPLLGKDVVVVQVDESEGGGA